MKVELKKQCRPDLKGYVTSEPLTEAEPFNANPRGILVHRIASARVHKIRGKFSHYSLDYWCGGCVNGAGVNMVAEPPEGRLLCARCEALAVAHEEASADFIAGRHVHIGHLKAVRDCCREEGN